MNKLFNKRIGAYINSKILERGYTVARLSLEIETCSANIYHILNGRSLPAFMTLVKLAIALNFSIDEMIEQCLEKIECETVSIEREKFAEWLNEI